jgi:two-component system chemotaxis response regulator CheY
VNASLNAAARAMLLESSFEAATAVREELEALNIELVEWSVSGAGWIAAWQKAKADIVIVDLQLPKRDGIYCIEKILSLNANTVVIFTHSYAGAMANDIEMKALAAGAASVLQKPYSRSRFGVSLARALAQVQKRRRATLSKI